MNMPQLPQFCIAMCWYMYYVHAPVATVLYCHVLVDVDCSTVNMPVATVLYCHAVAVL